MHFHLPKPVHGWRALIGEIGIIVVGVLIALGAEQLVEASHWRHEVEAERASLLQEASDSFGGPIARRRQQGCIDRRLADIRTLLLRHQRGESLGLAGGVGAPPHVSATRGSWQIALSGQALAHMPHEEKLAFSDVFGSFDLWDRATGREQDIWTAFAPLNDPELLTSNDWNEINRAYAQAKLVNERMRLLTPWMLKKTLPGVGRYRATGDLSGFKPLASEICKPILLANAAT